MLRKVLKTAVLGVLGLVALSGGWIAYGSRDLAAVDASDLAVERPPVDPEDNLRTHLDRLAGRIAWSEDFDEAALGLLRTEPFDRSAATSLLAPMEEALDALGPMLRMPQFRVPRLRSQDLGTLPPELDYGRLALGLALRSRRAAEAEHAERAVRDAFLILDLGQRLERATAAGLLTVMMSRAIKRRGLDALDRASRVVGFQPERAKQLARSLDVYRAAPDAWAGMWAVEHEWIAFRISEALADVPADLPVWVPAGYVFHPNRSLQMVADAYRVRLRNAYAPTCAATERPTGWDPGDPWQKLQVVLAPNSVGRLLFDPGLMPDLHRIGLRRCSLDVEVGATQARLALRAWRAEHGTLPEALEELMPTHLDAVPVDAFDGEPLRYERESERVWSVGSDLRDAGGRLEEGEDVLLEPSFPL